MAEPTRYERLFSFAGFQATQPNKPLPGNALDGELENVERSVNEAITAINDIRREDGALRNGIVTADALAPGLATGVSPATEWLSGVQYQAQNTVFFGSAFYRCVTGHVSGVFSADFAAGRWVRYADLGPIVDEAAAARDTAVISAATATAAASTATGASTAATTAANTATTLYDLFDDRYLGEKTSLPTLDNDGGALVDGALVSLTGQANPNANGMYVRRNGVWSLVIAPVQGVFLGYRFVAAGGQTTFTGADANGVTLSYTPGAVVVTLNGATLAPNTYTASSGSSIVLGTAASAGDTLVVYSFGSFSVADTWTRAEADARFLSASRAFGSRAAAVAATLPAHIQAVELSGRSAAGDGGGGRYVRLGVAPGTVRSWHFQSADGAWWELRAGPIDPRQLGAAGDGAADDTVPLQDALDYAGAFDVAVHVSKGVYLVPTASWVIPAGVIVRGVGDTSVIRRSTNAVVPLVRALNVANPAVRDLHLDSTAGWDSTSSISIGTGSRAFTVPAGLDILAGHTIQITATASPQNYMVGAVTAYSGTTMTINVTTAVGSGTFAAWALDRFDGENAALSFEGTTNADASGVIVTGRFYTGVRSLNGNGNTIHECEISGAVNRAVYLYSTSGTDDGSRVTNNRVRGGGLTQYGINLNGSGGTIENVVISGNVVDETVFQGIEVGGSCSFVTISGNHVDNVATGGSGILVQRANSVQPSRVAVTGNSVKNIAGVGTGIYLIDCIYCSVTGNVIAVCGFGIRVAQVAAGVGCQYNNIASNNVSSCTTDGIRFSAVVAGNCASHTCSGNVCVANTGTGILSEANTDRIAFAGNVSMANGAAYSTLGTNHIAGVNI